MKAKSDLERLVEALKEARASAFIELVLSKPKNRQQALKLLRIRPIKIKDQLMWQFTEHFETKKLVKNQSPSDALVQIPAIFETHFLEANLFLTDKHLQLLSNLKGNQKLLVKPAVSVQKPSLKHVKPKERFVHLDELHWQRLGLTDQTGNLFPSMQFKFKHIHQSIAILKPYLEPLMRLPQLRVVDMGQVKVISSLRFTNNFGSILSENFN